MADLGNLALLRQAAKAGHFRIRCEPRREGADLNAGMVWPMQIELPCINGLSCWFTVGNIYTPDRAAQGYTDGALSDDLARDFAAHIVGTLVAPPDEALAQAVAAARAETGWRPIETAPCDPMVDYDFDLPGNADEGLGYATDTDMGVIAFLVWWTRTGPGSSKVTHWRPLPASPTPAQTDTAPGGRADG